MRILKTFLLFIVLTVLSVNSFAQRTIEKDWCYTDQYMQEKYIQNPGLIQQNELIEQYLLDHRKEIIAEMNNSKKTINYTIPVVWHVVTYNGAGNVSKQDIDDQMLRLNEDFQRLNSDAINTRAIFAPYAADIQVEFRLAHKDPNGDCTEGIVRVESPLALDADDNVKGVSYWDSKKYFNIWTVITMNGDNPPSIILGYAQFPTSGINSTYGVVMRYNYIGRNERTLSHEVGHCFGLYHTFQSGCGNNCSNSGDRCCDTPPVTTSTQGCDVNQNSCSNDANGPDPYNANVVDQIENYMSYDACQNMFSEDQKIRMYSFLNSTSTSTGLNQLTTSGNLAFTGTANPYGSVTCKPIANFAYNKQYICEGDSISFTDQSYNAVPTAWNWTFTGGTPNTSSISNPTITYNTAGVYNATNRPSTSAGSDSITKNSIVIVSSLTADYTGPIIDGFENITLFNNDWRIENAQAGSQTWANNSVAAATGSNSVRIRNYFTNNVNEIDELISPSYDISTITNKVMKFKVAYCKKIATDNDKLLVYYSLNCGSSWSLKLPLAAAALASAPDQTGLFTPNSSQWIEKTVDLTSVGTATNIRFKFAFTSGGGNDIYLDDINISGTVGVNEFYSNIGSFNVFPNPTNSSASISFNLIKDVNNLSLKVKNSLGQDVTNVINGQSFKIGKYTLKIDEQRKLASGIYFVEFNADNNVKIQKLIVQ